MGWNVFAASSPGTAHRDRPAANQDAEGHQVEDGSVIIAVADGHGHARHFRSHTGASIAVEIAVTATQRWLQGFGAGGIDALASAGPAAAGEAVRLHLLPAITEAWRAAVWADATANPWAETGEMPGIAFSDPPEIAYGATLLLAVLGNALAVLAQIGDGDIVVVGRDGTAWVPVPGDPVLDGHVTTSLAQPDALAAFRVAVLDLLRQPLAIVLAASDGYGNAQVDNPWAPQVGADLWRMLAEYGTDWVASHLPEWVARCASGEGSGDDTTVALAIAEPAGPPAAGGTVGS